jgi:hypothetical protein
MPFVQLGGGPSRFFSIGVPFRNETAARIGFVRFE